MKINLVRIDDRLIHGQVATVWSKEANAQRIIICSDEVAKDQIRKTLLLQVGPPGVKVSVVEVAKAFADDGFKILATENTCKLIKEAGIEAEKVNKLSEGRPNILDLITNGNIDIIVNSPVGKDSVNDDSYLRKGAIKAKIPYYTTIAAAKAAAEGIAYVKAHQDQNEEVNSLQGLHAQISDKL